MLTHRSTGSTTASPAAVWSVLADFFALSAWATGIDHSSALTATPVGPGASRRVQVGSAVLLETVTAWEPERELGYQIQGLPPVAIGLENRWSLTARPDGGTDVSLCLTIDPLPRPVARVLVRLVQRRIARANQGLVDDLVAAASTVSTSSPARSKEAPW